MDVERTGPSRLLSVGPLAGLRSIFRAFRLLTDNREVRRRATLPFLINVIVFLVGLPLGIWQGLRLIEHFLPDQSGLVGILILLLKVIVVILLIVLSLLFFTAVGAIIAGPFSGPLSETVERIERERTGLAPLPELKRGISSDVGRGILYGLGRLLMFLLLYPVIFLIQFVPIIGTVLNLILAFLYSAFVLSIDFSDPVLDRKLETFRQKVRYVLDRKGTYLGFGGGSVVLMLLPFLNLVMIPVCVTAATLLYVDQNRD